MHADLVLSAASILLLSAAAAWGGASFARRGRPAAVVTVVAATILLLAVYFWFLHGSLTLARWLPFSGVIILGNWSAIGVGLLAGVVLGSRGVRRWRRVGLFAVLVGLGLFSLFRPLLRSAPRLGPEEWTEGRVCLQSSPASCSACAGATLLDHYGIDTSEAEMAELCLTDRSGTPALGLYRGLGRKTAESPYRVAVVQCDVESLLSADDWPVLLLCRLPDEDHPLFSHVRNWGWTPGAGHSVVVFSRFGAGGFDVGDPMVGRQVWTLRELQALWSGRAIQLVRR